MNKTGPKCRVCSSPKRAEIEARADGGDPLSLLASEYELSERAMQKHYATHGRASGVPTVSADGEATGREATAREVISELLRRVRKLMSDAENDPIATYRDRSALLTTAGTVAKLLGQLTGEFAVSEASIVASPQWRRVEVAIFEALKPFPDAAAAVLEALEELA